MNNGAVNELLRVLNEIAADVQHTKLKIDAIESALKGETPEAYSLYQKMLRHIGTLIGYGLWTWEKSRPTALFDQH